MMSDVTKKLNQHMPHDDFMAECNAIDIYVADLEKDSKKAYMLEIDLNLLSVKFKAADECCTEREITILKQLSEIKKLQEQIEGFGKVAK